MAVQSENQLGIPGWGADLDPKNRPAVPKERIPARDIGVHWDLPEQQVQKVPVFHSTERTGITPVFGSSSPPSGLSGLLRKVGFQFSENDLRHWLILLFADRVNMVEGILQDLASGHIPNVFGEMGLRSEIKHNPKGLAQKTLVAGAAVGLVAFLIMRSRKGDKDSGARLSHPG